MGKNGVHNKAILSCTYNPTMKEKANVTYLMAEHMMWSHQGNMK